MSLVAKSVGSPFGSHKVRTPKGEEITVPLNRAERRRLFALLPKLEKRIAREEFSQATRERGWHLRRLVELRKKMEAKAAA